MKKTYNPIRAFRERDASLKEEGYTLRERINYHIALPVGLLTGPAVMVPSFLLSPNEYPGVNPLLAGLGMGLAASLMATMPISMFAQDDISREVMNRNRKKLILENIREGSTQ